jgi:hypothetical protein
MFSIKGTLTRKKLRFLRNFHLQKRKKEILFFDPRYYDSNRPQISVKSLWQAADRLKKQFCTFLPASPVGSRPAKNWQSYCPCGSRWSNCFLKGADRTQLKSGVSIPGNESKR